MLRSHENWLSLYLVEVVQVDVVGIFYGAIYHVDQHAGLDHRWEYRRALGLVLVPSGAVMEVLPQPRDLRELQFP